MELWIEWYRVVQPLRACCSRQRTFFWMVAALALLSLPHDEFGVAGLMRAGRLPPVFYRGLLRFFHSTAIDLDRLTHLWVSLVLKVFQPITVDGVRPLVVADGIKAPKEGLKMPGVKSLHQESGNNSKAEYIMGHSIQAVAILVKSSASLVLAVPLIARIHEGLKFTNRDTRTLPEKLAEMMLSALKSVISVPVVLVADAYYACAPLIAPLLRCGHHLISRVRSTAVAFYPAIVETGRRGRPRKYGRKVKLKSFFKRKELFSTAIVYLYGENVTVRYYSIDLLWMPLRRLIRFVLVDVANKGHVILLATDLSLSPLIIIESYGRRFRIEVTFRAAIHSIRAFCYRFWMMNMVPIHRGQGTQYLHRTCNSYRVAVRRKVEAYHLWIQLSLIAQGLLQYMAVNLSKVVWAAYSDFMRTARKDLPPSEQVVAGALREELARFPLVAKADVKLRKFLIHIRGPYQKYHLEARMNR